VAGDPDDPVAFDGRVTYLPIPSSKDINEVLFRYIFSPKVQQLFKVSQPGRDEAKKELA
jgi:hypothetical protein